MTFYDILMLILGLGIVLGAIDKIIGNKFGIGERFDASFKDLGLVAAVVMGAISIAPVVASYLSGFFSPIFSENGIDLSVTAMFIPSEIGGYANAVSIGENKAVAQIIGTTVSSMFGTTFLLIIPVGMGIIAEDDHKYFFKGILFGIIAMPVGAIFSGLFYGVTIKRMIINTVPLLLISAVLVISILILQNAIIHAFVFLGRFFMVIAIGAFALSAYSHLTGITIISGMLSFEESGAGLLKIAVIMIGSYPVIYIIKTLMKKPLGFLGDRIGLNGDGILGMVVTMFCNYPVFSMYGSMNEKGKTANSAWMTTMTATFGSLFIFVKQVAPAVLPAMIFGKIIAGVLAAALAIWTTPGKKE